MRAMIVAALAALLLLPGLLVGPSLDAAVFTYAARELLNGDVLYVGVWDHKPPGIHLLLAAGQALVPVFSPWLVTWLLSLAATAATGLLTSNAARRAGATHGGAVAAAVAATIISGQYLLALGGGLSEPFAAVLLGGGLLLAIRRDAVGAPVALGIGICMGLAALVSVQALPGAVTVAGLAALAGAAGGDRLRVATVLFIGALAPVLAVAGWLATVGALPAAVDAVLEYSTAYRGANLAVLRLSIAVGAWTILALLFAVVPAALGARHALRYGERARTMAIAGLAWMFLTVALVAVQGRFFAHYLVPLAIPLGLLAGLGFDALSTRIRALRSRASQAIVASPVLIGLIVSGWAAVAGGAMEVRHIAADNERSRAVAAELERRTDAADAIWVWGNQPQVYLAAERSSATRYAYLFPLVTPGYATNAMVLEVVAQLRDDAPVAIVDAGSSQPGEPGFQPLLVPRSLASDGRDLDVLDPLREFVAAHYEEETTIAGWVIYVLSGR